MSNEKEKKKIQWITDEAIEANKIILLSEDDPRGFLHTDKTPKEIDEIVERYLKKNPPKIYVVSSPEEDKKKNE